MVNPARHMMDLTVDPSTLDLSSQPAKGTAAACIEIPDDETHSSQPATFPGPNIIDLAEIDDEDDPVEVAYQVSKVDRKGLPRNPIFIDLDLLVLGATEESEVAMLDTVKRRRSTVIPLRNPDIKYPLMILAEYEYNKLRLRANKIVQLQNLDYLKVISIIRNVTNNEMHLRGVRVQIARHLNGMLDNKLNEAVLCYEVELDDPRDHEVQAAIEVPLSEVTRLRSATRFTNQTFPEVRSTDPSLFRSATEANLEGGLTIRWKYTCLYLSPSHRKQNAFKERRIERLRTKESSPQFTVDELKLMTRWRGETIRGGSWKPRDMPFNSWPAYRQHLSQARNLEFPSQSGRHELEDDDPEVIFLGENISPVLERKRPSSSADSRSTRVRLSSTQETSNTETWPPNVGVGSEPRQRQIPVIDLSEEVPPADQSNSPRNLDVNLSDNSLPPSSGAICTNPSKSQQPRLRRLAGQKYTYGDAFCGAGGTTRGAVMAGLKVKWGFDFNAHACATWRANFKDAMCFESSDHEFLSFVTNVQQVNPTDSIPHLALVDILHLSPPCQYFSPAHTIKGRNDDRNSASLFGVDDIIKVSQPRVVTLEQTFGIASSKFRLYFNSLIRMFTTHGFSIRWAIVPLAQWGLPARRMRLIIIASCPGEALPSMPAATHSLNGTNGLKPFVSVAKALSTISPNATDHNIPRNSTPRGPPWDGSGILPRAMTTSGGQNYHFSGARDFTIREYAVLQGFPDNHHFEGSYKKMQIGNAVPPVVAKVLFESIIKDLEKADGIVGEPQLIE